MTMSIKLLMSSNCLYKFYFLYKLIKNKTKQNKQKKKEGSEGRACDSFTLAPFNIHLPL